MSCLQPTRSNYPNKCGSCKHMVLQVVGERTYFRGHCSLTGKYKQTSDNSCRKYKFFEISEPSSVSDKEKKNEKS